MRLPSGPRRRRSLGLRLLLFFLFLLLFFLFLLVRLLLGQRGLDLGLDLVAQLDVGLVLGGELVAAAELAQLGRRDVELVGDPGVGAALAHPGADLVQL